MANNENRDKLPIKLKSERFFVTGSKEGGDTILTSSFQLASASFAEKKYLTNDYLTWTEGAIIYQLQNMQDDMTHLHKEVSQSVYETSISEFASISSASFGVISSSLIPDKKIKHHLGSSGKEWHTSYMLTASIGGGIFTSASLAAGGSGGGSSNITVDTSITNGSTNPVTNDAIHDALANKQSTLTFGKSSGNALKSEEALSTNDVLLMGSSHVKGRTYSNFKSDLSLVKGDVGLGNVDNTTDANKPVSTATQTALNAKATTAAVAGDLIPDKDDKYDLGSSTKEWQDLYVDGVANVDELSLGVISTDLIPKTAAQKGSGQNLGSPKARWSRIWLASNIDVSGSSLVISSPSASAAGDDFNVVVSGSIVPGDTDSGSLGSIDAPFKDLFIQSSSIYLADMSTHNFGSGNKSWKQMSKSEKLQRSTIFRKDDVDKLKRGESLNDSGHISASGNFHVVGSTHLRGTTLIEGNTTIDGLTDVKGGFRINGQAITDAELQALRGLSTGDGSIQTQLDTKHATIDAGNRLNANLIGGGNVSSIEFNQLDGIGTSTIATQLSAKQDTITFGIGNKEVIKCGTGIVDDDFLRINGTSLEGRSASELKGDLSLVKGDVGLGNVDNTSDASKPVSTLTTAALGKKLNLTGGTMTGLVAEPFVLTDSATIATAKGAIDARATRVFQIMNAKGQTWNVALATPAYRGQELTIIAMGAGTITHTNPGKLTPAGIFVSPNGSNISVAANTAVKFVANRQQYWIQIV